MEGLIPFVYKAIKERRRRSYSRCSSAASSAAFGARAVHDNVWEPARKQEPDDGGKFHAERETAHRRHRSLEELAGEVGASSAALWRPGAMTRERSVRIFSCISGM